VTFNQYSRPASARRPNTDEHRACQADPSVFGLFDGQIIDLAQTLAAARAMIG
jgi:hypothetical protein